MEAFVIFVLVGLVLCNTASETRDRPVSSDGHDKDTVTVIDVFNDRLDSSMDLSSLDRYRTDVTVVTNSHLEDFLTVVTFTFRKMGRQTDVRTVSSNGKANGNHHRSTMSLIDSPNFVTFVHDVQMEVIGTVVSLALPNGDGMRRTMVGTDTRDKHPR